MKKTHEIRQRDFSRRGFSLIELLIVVTIIALLAGLSTVVYRGVQGLFRGTVSKNALANMSAALEQYKQKYGEYPPDATESESAVRAHILKRWPKVLKNKSALSLFKETLYQKDEAGNFILDENGEPILENPNGFLMFWLVGPDRNGFSEDENNPMRPGDEGRLTPLIEISSDNEKDGVLVDQKGFPIIYFRASKASMEDENGEKTLKGYFGKDLEIEAEDKEGQKVENCVKPYMKNGVWYNPDSYQLILPGEDGIYGETHQSEDDLEETYEPKDLADPATLTSGDYDNVTNFGEGAVLSSLME